MLFRRILENWFSVCSVSPESDFLKYNPSGVTFELGLGQKYVCRQLDWGEIGGLGSQVDRGVPAYKHVDKKQSCR